MLQTAIYVHASTCSITDVIIYSEITAVYES